MSRRCLRVISLTNQLIDYRPSVELQERLVAAVKAGTAPDTVVVLQHHPVFTVGKRGTPADLLTDTQKLAELRIDVVSVPRGGETTYHGPGQLVAYPICDLRALRLGARAFVEGLEDAMVNTVGCFGIQARGRVPGKTGAWVGERKIGAVGVRITHGISSHGIALNVTTDLSAYKHIVPCGTPDKEVTSVQQELCRPAGRWRDGTAKICVQQQQQQHLERIQQEPGVGPDALLATAEACLVDCLAHALGLEAVRHDFDEALLE